MAFKLRLQIFFLILTVLPLLVGGWMIQRTVVESRRSSIDQRLAGGVGTLGTQYGAVLDAGRRQLQTLPRNSQLQKALVEGDDVTVRRLADLAAGGGLEITVRDPGGALITGRAPQGARRIGTTQIGGDPSLATVTAYADIGA